MRSNGAGPAPGRWHNAAQRFPMRSRLLDLRPVRARLFTALGLSPIALAGCGGLVVFVDDEGTGGEGGGTTTTVSTTGTVGTTNVSSSSTGLSCDVPGVIYACNENAVGLCPPAGTPGAEALMSAVLEESWECEDFCWCTTWVTSVPCGPDPASTLGCCYYVTTTTDEACMGRPFEVEGRVRVASSTSRADWDTAAAVDATALDEPTRRALADAYRRDALYEHASVASFARFALDLLALGAPARLVRLAQQAMGEEVRHAELSFGVAAALDGRREGPGALAVAGALDGRADPIAILEAVIEEGCVGETLSALVVLAARDAAEDEGVRAALDEIARDELAHAELAWATVAWARAQGTPEVVRAIDSALAGIRAPLALEGDPPVDARTLRAFGRLPRRERAAVMRAGFDDVVAPLAAALRSGAPAVVAPGAAAWCRSA